MNNTTRRNLTIVAIFMVATLVVGMFAATPITQTAFAYSQKNKGDDNSRNGNTVTIQKCKQAATQSGFDNTQQQECQNLICTHPGTNATCTQERVVVTPPALVNKTTCEQCFTTILTSDQITPFLNELRALGVDVSSIPDLCTLLQQTITDEETLLLAAINAGIPLTTAQELVQCLKDTGIVFTT